MFEPGEKDGWMVKLLHNKTGRIKQTTERPQHGGVIVEEPDTIAGGSAQRRAFRVQIFESIKGICIGHVESSLVSHNYYGTLIRCRAMRR